MSYNRLSISHLKVSYGMCSFFKHTCFFFKRNRFQFFSPLITVHLKVSAMAPHSSTLAWRIPGTGEPGELPSMGSHRVGHDWSDLALAKVSANSRYSLVQISSVTQLCLTLCDPVNCSRPGLTVHHQLPEFTQTRVHWVGDAIQTFHPLSSHSHPSLNLSQHQGLFKWVSSSHQVAKVLEFQFQHQSFQWTPRTDIL